jgi:fluoride exporter
VALKRYFPLRPGQLPRGRIIRAPADLFLVFAGGCVGGAIRYAAGAVSPPGFRFPWPTLAVNLAGAFVVCLVVVLSESLTSARGMRLFVGIGLCGSLTTFASIVDFAYRAIADGRAGEATAYLAASILGGLVVGSLGFVVGRSVAESRRRLAGERRRA